MPARVPVGSDFGQILVVGAPVQRSLGTGKFESVRVCTGRSPVVVKRETPSKVSVDSRNVDLVD